MNKNVMINAFDSGEEFEGGSWFLKGSILTVLWSSTINCVEVDCMRNKEYGW